MTTTEDRPLRAVSDFYDEPQIAWSTRTVGRHLHPGSEDATVELARRAAHHGFPGGGLILDVASALGEPARFLARRFSATVVCVDMDPRMHAAALHTSRTEGLGLRCQPVLARTERLPLAAASIDGAWSQDAMCHMEKPPVVEEVARVLRPGGVFAFSDWIAHTGLTDDDRANLRRLWAFPSLLSIPDYVALLDRSGFEVLLAEERTRAVIGDRRLDPPMDQELWELAFVRRFGEAELERQRGPSVLWRDLIVSGRTGYAMFIGRKRG